MVQTEQHKLARMGLERLQRMDNAKVVPGARVTGVTQHSSTVTIFTDDAPYEADYVIGCDGGRSTVRKSLGIEFEGFTWPERFLVITTPYDFAAALGCCYRNYMAGPQEWTNLFKVAGDDLKGRWRAVFNTREDESDGKRFRRFGAARLGASTCPRRTRALHLNLYNVHQRVAKRFRVGRVFLCGDAAHVNNPIGGLGLNSGIHEAWHLANLLASSAGRRGPRRVRAAPPAAQRRVRAAADHRQQAPPGRARSGEARRALRRAARHGRRPEEARGLPLARLAAGDLESLTSRA